MLTFLFWNLGGIPKSVPDKVVRKRETVLKGIVANLTRQHQVDVLMLAECPLSGQELVEELNLQNPKPEPTGFRLPDPRSQCERVVIFPRFPMRFLKLRRESTKFTSRFVRLPGREELTLFVVHFASKRYRSDESQRLAVPGFSQEIRLLEQEAGHGRTLLVGDLNMNPYELGIVGAEGLNAVMTREIAYLGSRTIDGRDYPFFYNPMWNHFGDAGHDVHPPGSPEHAPAGTCYYPSAESRWYFWNMFDQVLLRPTLLPFFKNEAVRILVTDGNTSLLTEKGLPDRRAISDHLPLLFRLNV